jgi:hypothetical protein
MRAWNTETSLLKRAMPVKFNPSMHSQQGEKQVQRLWWDGLLQTTWQRQISMQDMQTGPKGGMRKPVAHGKHNPTNTTILDYPIRSQQLP